jgi:DNA repair and recombination protein RAD52
MWKKEWTDELKRPLNSKHVRKRKQGGMTLSYIESHHAIREMNAIFGYGEWSYQVDRLDMVSQEKNIKGNHIITYLCVVTVTVNGTTRQDTGAGSGIGKDIGKAHEGASKEAVSDALKRCLRTFGDRFGLALYDKEQKHVVDNRDVIKKELFIKRIDKMLKTEKRDVISVAIKEGLKENIINKEDDIYLKCVERFTHEDKMAEEDVPQ